MARLMLFYSERELEESSFSYERTETMPVVLRHNMNESELSERLKYIRGAEDILSQAVKEYSRLTGIEVKDIRNHLTIQCIDESLTWVEFDYRDSHFYYRKHE